MMLWEKGMRDRLTGQRHPHEGTCEVWIPAGGEGLYAIPDGTDPLTVALMKLQAVEEVCCKLKSRSTDVRESAMCRHHYVVAWSMLNKALRLEV